MFFQADNCKAGNGNIEQDLGVKSSNKNLTPKAWRESATSLTKNVMG